MQRRLRELMDLSSEPLSVHVLYLLGGNLLAALAVLTNTTWWLAVFASFFLYLGSYLLVKSLDIPRPNRGGYFSDQGPPIGHAHEIGIWLTRKCVSMAGMVLAIPLFVVSWAIVTVVFGALFEHTGFLVTTLLSSLFTGWWLSDRYLHQYSWKLPEDWQRPLDKK